MSGPLEVRSGFCMLVARWRLTQAEVRSLLGLGEDTCRDRVCPADPGAGVLGRIRLAVAVEAGLRDLLGAERSAAWIRRPSRSYGGSTPLQAMADLEVLTALFRVSGVCDADPRGRRS